MVYIPLNMSAEEMRDSLVAYVKLLNEKEADLTRREERVRLREEELMRLDMERQNGVGGLGGNSHESKSTTITTKREVMMAAAFAQSPNKPISAVGPFFSQAVTRNRLETSVLGSASAPTQHRSLSQLNVRELAISAEPRHEKGIASHSAGKVTKPRAKQSNQSGKKTEIRMNAYRIFQKAKMSELGARGIRAAEACKALAVEWKALPAGEKAKLVTQADELNRQAESLAQKQ